jgi:hypothetical protein
MASVHLLQIAETNTCNNAYIGQSGRSITVRPKEHVRYVRTNNPASAYALHILINMNMGLQQKH